MAVNMKKNYCISILAFFMSFVAIGMAQEIGDRPNVHHVSQEAIDAGLISFQELFDLGGDLFTVDFNTLDGYGRPNVNAGGVPVDTPNDLYTRTFGPDASSCVECHNKPFAGGAGGNAVNVFIRSWDSKNPFSAKEGDSNERNTKHIFGSGGLELIAREMSAQLQAIERDAISEATSTGHAVQRALIAKGIDFGHLVAMPDGAVDKNGVVGVDKDLMIKPFGSKGSVESVRRFTTNPLLHHSGIQPVERLEDNPIPGVDAPNGFRQADDGDSYDNEATRGDVTALVIWQAAQPVPIQQIPDAPAIAQAIANGDATFKAIGCATCHVPQMVIDDPIFREQSRLDPTKSFRFDITREGAEPRFERTPDGKAIIRAYGDLKRHYMGEGLREPLPQDGVDSATFITAELWGVGNTFPWMFNGRSFTLDDAIRVHGGEAQAARDAYAALPEIKQREVVEFLKSLVLPPNFQADIELEKGINMISLPLKPYRPLTARDLDAKLNASICIRFNPARQRFEGYTSADEGDGFPIEGGKGYIVNVLEATTVTMTGDAWHRGEPNVRSSTRAPSLNEISNKWAFVLSGKLVTDVPAQSYTIFARNQRTGVVATDVLDGGKGTFSAVWLDQMRQPVVQIGDAIEIVVMDASGQRVVGPLAHIVSAEELDLAYVHKLLRSGDIMPLQTRLAQNFPNPFNPETWIPYQLAQSAPVKIEIYDAAGRVIRTLNLGTQPAGFYLTKERAAYWDGTNRQGEKVGSGVYFYTFTAGDWVATKKLVVVK